MSRFPITDDDRKAIVGAMVSIATDNSKKPRDRVAAANAVVAADRLNLAAERDRPRPQPLAITQTEPTGNRFLVVAQQLNLTVSASSDAAIETPGDAKPDEAAPQL